MSTTSIRRDRLLSESYIVAKDIVPAGQPQTWGVYQWADDEGALKFRSPVRTGFVSEGDAEKWIRAREATEKKPWE